MGKVLFRLVFLAHVSSFFAVAHAGQSFTNLEVRWVSTGWGAEGVYVQTAESQVSPQGCSGAKFMIPADHPMLKIMTAALFSALHARTRVDLFAEGCVDGELMKLMAVALSTNPI